MRLLVCAIFGVALFLTGTAQGQQGVPDKMGGTGYAKQVGKSCSVYANACLKNNPSASGKCQSARVRCMETGTFVGPQGASFSGLAKN